LDKLLKGITYGSRVFCAPNNKKGCKNMLGEPDSPLCKKQWKLQNRDLVPGKQ
jgi:hypothetical protein